MDRLLRILVVDDSAYVRKVVSQMLARSPYIDVVGTAKDGLDALEQVEALQPDLVTLDLIMPNLDGIGFLREQMARKPLPVVVVSIANENGDMALEALDAGAIDFVQKPTALATEKVFEISDELIRKVKAAANVSIGRLPILAQPFSPVTPLSPLSGEESNLGASVAQLARKHKTEIVVFGISTGGPQALKQILPQLPSNFPVPVAVVLHMPVGYTKLYANKLDEICPLRVVEAQEGEPIQAGTIILAQAGRHLSLVRNRHNVTAHLDARPFDTPHRPAVDVLFRSAAEVYGEGVLGVVMTGMGSDGKEGSAWVKARGGRVLTEAEESCVVYGMPRSVVEAGLSDLSAPLDKITQTIMAML
jgi:two-component system chemotaxis response regulator CheB